MIKKMLLLAAVVAVGVVNADIKINFENLGGTIYQAGVPAPDFVSYVDTAYVQLIWTANAVVTEDYAKIGGVVGDGEWLLADLTTTSGFAGTWSDQFMIVTTADADVGGANILNGNFFIRVFDSSKLGGGDFYLQQAVEVGPLTEYALPGDIYQTNGKVGGELALDGLGKGAVEGSYQIIPEPATFGLMGVAGIGMFLARRKARR